MKRREKIDSSQNCMEGDIRQEALDTQSKLTSKPNDKWWIMHSKHSRIHNAMESREFMTKCIGEYC
jgi:hypothetical protein